jgi:hypothetical protein
MLEAQGIYRCWEQTYIMEKLRSAGQLISSWSPAGDPVGSKDCSRLDKGQPPATWIAPAAAALAVIRFKVRNDLATIC